MNIGTALAIFDQHDLQSSGVAHVDIVATHVGKYSTSVCSVFPFELIR
jgi:hypothetical protein